MKNTLIIFLTTLILLSTMSIAHSEEEVLLTSGEWPPYFSKSFKYGGLGTRISSEAFKLAGITALYDFQPWKRAFDSAKHGDQYAGTIAWRKTPAREKLFHFSDPLFHESVVFFHRTDMKLKWGSFDDVGGLTIGATLGYSYIDVLTPAIEKGGGKLDIAPTDEVNLQKLIMGRIDIFPCAESVAYYLLRTKFMPGASDLIRHHPKPIIEGSLHLLISKKAPNGEKIVKRFNAGLSQLRKSGRYDLFWRESLQGMYLPEADKLQRKRNSSSTF